MFSSDRRFLFRVFLFSISFHAPSRASREARENERGHGMAIGHRMGTRWYPWTGRESISYYKGVKNLSEKENSRVEIGMAREDLFDSKIPRRRV
jgi:hypothetical protein